MKFFFGHDSDDFESEIVRFWVLFKKKIDEKNVEIFCWKAVEHEPVQKHAGSRGAAPAGGAGGAKIGPADRSLGITCRLFIAVSLLSTLLVHSNISKLKIFDYKSRQ